MFERAAYSLLLPIVMAAAVMLHDLLSMMVGVGGGGVGEGVGGI